MLARLKGKRGKRGPRAAPKLGPPGLEGSRSGETSHERTSSRQMGDG